MNFLEFLARTYKNCRGLKQNHGKRYRDNYYSLFSEYFHNAATYPVNSIAIFTIIHIITKINIKINTFDISTTSTIIIIIIFIIIMKRTFLTRYWPSETNPEPDKTPNLSC